MTDATDWPYKEGEFLGKRVVLEFLDFEDPVETNGFGECVL